MKRSTPNHPQGFALVIALSLMAFILMLCLSLTTLVRVEMQNIHVKYDVSLARSNALLGLQIALGELQKSAGPDQRVTATADLVDGLADDTHRRWTGVWDVSNRDPFAPFSSATQVDWLVSGKDLSGSDLIPGGEVQNPVTLYEDASNPSNEVVVGLESIDNQWVNGHYAYWVADEGVKAKVNLTDPHRLTSGLAANDYHFSQMTGQRTGIEKVTLPDSSVVGDYLDPLDSVIESQIERMSTLDQLPLIESGLADLPAILLHDLTTSSFGILSNVAEGGLKQDLSLAFEMDLDDFNADTNFAAGGESLAPGVNGTITGHEIRYLFTHNYTPNGDGIRGPTWHLLRNYYRLYLQNDPDRFVDYKTAHPKGVERKGSRYTIDSRPFFPQMKDGSASNNYSLPAALYYTGTYDMNVSNFYGGGTTRVPRPTDMQIHPVVTRVQLFLSLQAVKVFPDPDSTDYKYRIDLLASPVVTIWNPYNVELDFEQMDVNWNFLILPLEFTYQEPGETLKTINLKLGDANETKNFSYAGLICYLGGSTLAPGQVKVYSTVDSIGENAGSSGKSFTANLSPYSGSLEAEAKCFRFDQIKVTVNEGDNSVIESKQLIVEPGTEIRVSGESGGGATGGYSDKLLVSSNLVWPSNGKSSAFNISSGTLQNPTGAREFYWPEEDPSYFGLVEDILEYNESDGDGPFRHPLGLIDTYLKPSGTIDMNHPVQFLARYNPRAQSIRRMTGGDNDGYDFPVVGNWSYNIRPFTDWNADIVAVDAGNGNGFWGQDNRNGVQHVVLFELPTAPLQSLAAFQHVNNISRYSQEPAFVVGNSYGSPFIAPNSVTERLLSRNFTQVDWSYFANEALWDNYYFSSLTPREDLDEDFETSLNRYLRRDELPNSRMIFDGTPATVVLGNLVDVNADSKIAADAYQKSAKYLMVDGAFNVNSTSVEAWKAVLAAANGIDVAYINGNSISSAGEQPSPFSRMTLPGGDNSDDWKGFRSLTDAQLDALAHAIVAQVKLRGPFTSLADFVNRRLSADETALMGPLQAAIEATTVNDNFTEVVTEGDLEDPGVTYSEGSNYPYKSHATGPTAAAATGYLLQSDILMSLGPVLSARSDTFKIRAYGDYEDPVTGQKTTARCEAIVQRLPEYVDPSDDANLPTLQLTSKANLDFGRRFVIRSIQWLD